MQKWIGLGFLVLAFALSFDRNPLSFTAIFVSVVTLSRYMPDALPHEAARPFLVAGILMLAMGATTLSPVITAVVYVYWAVTILAAVILGLLSE